MPKKPMKYIIAAIFIICLLILAALFILGRYSQSQTLNRQDLTVLPPCGSPLNCVCSEHGQDKAYYIKPIDLTDQAQIVDLALAVPVVTAMGGRITVQQPDYIAAVFKSGIFGFVDDFELRLDLETRSLHIRSASRVGRSDLGVNKLRADRFREEFLSRL